MVDQVVERAGSLLPLDQRYEAANFPPLTQAQIDANIGASRVAICPPDILRDKFAVAAVVQLGYKIEQRPYTTLEKIMSFVYQPKEEVLRLFSNLWNTGIQRVSRLATTVL